MTYCKARAARITGFPGYNSIICPENATIGRILLDNGYRTAWFGKDHNAPDWQMSQAGSFGQWPMGTVLLRVRGRRRGNPTCSEFARMREVFVQSQPRLATPQDARERRLAHLDRLTSEVPAVEVKQVEGV